MIPGSSRALRENGNWRGGGQGAKSQCLAHCKVFVFVSKSKSEHFKVFRISRGHNKC